MTQSQKANKAICEFSSKLMSVKVIRMSKILSVDKYSLFQSLMNAYSKAYPMKTKKQHQLDVTEIWNQIKKENNLSELVSQKVLEYNEKSMQSKASLFSYWKSAAKCDVSSSTDNIDSNIHNESEEIINLSNSFEECQINSSKNDDTKVDKGFDDKELDLLQVKPNIETPAQSKLQLESLMRPELSKLYF